MLDLSLLPAALLGLSVALLVGINAMRIGRALGVLDRPDGARKLHRRVTPLVGGMAVAAAALGGMALAMLTDGDRSLIGLAVAVAAMFTIGFIDDREHQSPAKRLLATMVVLFLVITVAPDFRLVALKFAGVTPTFDLGVVFGSFFTIVCLVGLLNAINMADGKDGIVVGMALVWTVVLGTHAPPLLAPVLVATSAALAVLLGFNMAGKLFLGDGGSYALSTLFGLMAIFTYNSTGSTMAADDVALMFAVPVFDTIRLMAVRAARGRSPFEGDRDHLHHHIHARIGWPRGLGVYLALIAIPNAGAVIWPGTAAMWLASSFVAYAAVIVTMRVPQADGAPAE